MGSVWTSTEAGPGRVDLPAERRRAPRFIPASDAGVAALLLILAALLLGAIYCFGCLLPQTAGRMQRASAELIPTQPVWSFLTSLPVPVPQSAETVALVVLIGAALGFIAYALTVYLMWDCQAVGTRRLVVALGVLLLFASIWVLPNLNTDMFNYIVRARLMAEYDANPYYVAADDYPDDPVYPYAGHQETRDPNGKFPAWMLWNIALARIAGDDPARALLIYRAAFLLFNLAVLSMIALVVRRLLPRRQTVAMVLYAWNPIVILFGQNKTDTIMVFYLCIAALLVAHRRRLLPYAALALSVFVKLVTLPLAMVYWLRDLRLRRYRDLLLGSLLFLVTVAIIYLPLIEGPELLLVHLGLLKSGGESAPDIARFVLGVGFVVLIFAAGLLQDGSRRRLLGGWILVMLYFSLCIAKVGYSWYLITLIALVAMLPDWRFAGITVVLSWMAFTFNAWDLVYTRSFPSPDIAPIPRWIIYMVPVAAAAGASLAISLLRRPRAPAATSSDSPSDASPIG